MKRKFLISETPAVTCNECLHIHSQPHPYSKPMLAIQLRPSDCGNIVQDPEYFTQNHRFRFHAGSYERNFSHRSIDSSYGFQSDIDPFIKYNGICARRHVSGISYLYELRYPGHCAVWFSIFSCFF